MSEFLQLIQDGDLRVPVPRCGVLLTLARSRGWIVDDLRRVLVITAAGKAWLLEHPAP